MAARALAAGVLAGATSALALRLLRDTPPGGAGLWDRTNHAGQSVTLLEGPAFVAGSALAALPAGPGPVVAALGAGALGALDDLAGDARSKGLKGHLSALARGEVTTGAMKVVGLGVAGVLSAALVDARRGAGGGATAREVGPTAFDTLVGGAVIAGAANLLNLLDLRPGRSLKAAVIAGALTAADPRAEVASGAVVGAAAALLGPDLAGETMLGDTGANSAGALLGSAFVARSGRRGRLGALAVLTALTLASERVSFTKVIEATPGLRELDALGRA
ncbi:MAG TPA: hypothetical protein VH915_00595 [Pedococcus sp.]|jgi:hypothetical protein